MFALHCTMNLKRHVTLVALKGGTWGLYGLSGLYQHTTLHGSILDPQNSLHSWLWNLRYLSLIGGSIVYILGWVSYMDHEIKNTKTSKRFNSRWEDWYSNTVLRPGDDGDTWWCHSRGAWLRDRAEQQQWADWSTATSSVNDGTDLATPMQHANRRLAHGWWTNWFDQFLWW